MGGVPLVPSDLITISLPSPNRALKCECGVEHHLTEGGVMLAFAFHLFRSVPGLKHVAMHPDGEHAKKLCFPDRLAARGFKLTRQVGTTSYGGVYEHDDGRTVLVNPKSGLFDVVADLGNTSFVAECKGGVINSSHAGQLSRLRSGMCEATGQLLAQPTRDGQRQFVVMLLTRTTLLLGQRMHERASAASIEIALVDRHGEVTIVGHPRG